MDRRRALMREYTFHGDGTMLNVEVIVSVVDEPKGLSSLMSCQLVRGLPHELDRDEPKCIPSDSTSTQPLL